MTIESAPCQGDGAAQSIDHQIDFTAGEVERGHEAQQCWTWRVEQQAGVTPVGLRFDLIARRRYHLCAYLLLQLQGAQQADAAFGARSSSAESAVRDDDR